MAVREDLLAAAVSVIRLPVQLFLRSRLHRQQSFHHVPVQGQGPARHHQQRPGLRPVHGPQPGPTLAPTGRQQRLRQDHASSSLSLYKPLQIGLLFSIHSILLARFHFLTAFPP